MANPCVIIFKGKEYSFAEFASMLHDGLLDELVKSGEVDGSRLKTYKGDITPPTVQKTEEFTGREQTPEIEQGTPAKEQIPLTGENKPSINEISPDQTISEGNVPPTGESGSNEVIEGGKGEKYTIGLRAMNSDKLSDDVKQGIEKEGIEYIPRGKKIRSEEAQEIIDLYSKEDGGLDKIESMVYNTENGIPNDTRTVLNVYLAEKYGQLKDASSSPAERDRFRQKAVDLFMFGMEQGKLGGQWVEAQKEWGRVLGSSPEMVQAIARNHIDRKNKAFFDSHAEPIKQGKELLDEIFNSEEGRKRIEEEVNAEISKIGTKTFGAEGKKKVDDFFNGLLIDPKRQQFYDALLGIPIAAWNGSVLAVKKAVLLGMDVATAIKAGSDYLDKWYKENYAGGKVGSPDWSRKDYEAHMKDQLKGLKKEVPLKEKAPRKPKEKTLPSEEEVLNKLLEKMAGFATKKQLQNFVKQYFQEHSEKGYVSDQRYKDLLSKALGLEHMTPDIEAGLTAASQALGHAQKKAKELQEAFDKLIAIADPKSKEFKEGMETLNRLKKETDKAVFEAKKANQFIKTTFTDEGGMLDKVGSLIQGNLLVPASVLRNLYGNIFMLPFRGTRFLIMNMGDSMLSAIGKQAEKMNIDPVAHPDMYRWAQKLPSSQRTVKMGASAQGYGEGWWKGLKEGLRQVKTGQLEDDYHKKEVQRGLEPVKAAQRIYDAMTGKEKREFSKLIGDILEALPAGYTGEAMFRMLNLGDKPFRRAAEEARLGELAEIKGLTGLAKDKFMNSPDEESLKESQKAGDIAVYTNDNVVSKLIQHANTTISKGVANNDKAIHNTSVIAKALFKLGKATTLPYVRTPVNLAIETFEYAVPPYSLARSVESMVKGNRREALDYFGKAVVGTMIASVATTLIQNGIMTPAPSDDKKVKQAEFTGKEGYRLNLDALQRLLHGESTEWQDGDQTMTLKGFGTLSMIMMAYGAAYKDLTPEEIEKQSNPEKWATVFGSVVTSSLEQSIMTGVNTALQAALKGERERDQWLMNTANALSTAVYPNTLASISKTFADDNYLREVRDMSKEEERLKTQMINTFKDRMFMGKDLPRKINIWGEPVKIIPDGQSWTFALLGVSKKKEYQKNTFGSRMFDLYEQYKKQDPEEAKNIFPMLPDSRTKVGWDDSKMNAHDLEKYQIRVGELRAMYAENYINSEEFKSDDIPDKVSRLTTMYSKARKIAESEMFDWTAFKNRNGEDWNTLNEAGALPIPSMVQKVVDINLKPEDIEMLNDIAIGYYSERAKDYLSKGDIEKDKKDIPNPQDGKSKFVIRLNAYWQGAIAKAKADMHKILKESKSK